MTLIQTYGSELPVEMVLAHRIGPVAIASMNWTQAIDHVEAALAWPSHLKLGFANSHVVNLASTDLQFAQSLAGFLLLPDGVGVELGALILHGTTFPDNLNGTDFIPALMAHSSRPLTIGLVGARNGVAQRAADSLRALAPQHHVVVFSDGYFSEADEPALLQALTEKRPDLLLVALGNPKQELWIASKLDWRHCSVAAGVGALFDFLAGEVVRAPRPVRVARLEWAFRLLQEPRRLWRRYILGNPAFILRILLQKWRAR